MASGVATFDGAEFATIAEGKATILFPTNNEVFYNPVQEFNRDMSIAALQTWHKTWSEEKLTKLAKKQQMRGECNVVPSTLPNALVCHSEETTESPLRPTFTVLEALAATGLRSIRYAKEVPGIRHIVANDLDPEAVQNIERNIAYNNVTPGLITPNKGDAMEVLYSHLNGLKHFDVIDLDPYGSASMFLDGAVQAVSDGGLLCITCTDMQVLAGANFVETCFSKYGGMPLKADFCHEMALRLVLHALQTSAARYKLQIVPLLSCSIDFYVRLFVRVNRSANAVKMTASRTSIVHRCQGCNSFELTPFGRAVENEEKPGVFKYTLSSTQGSNECGICGGRYHIGGPIWNGPLHDKSFVRQMLQHVKNSESEKSYGTQARMLGMLTVISEEIETPLYWSLKDLTKTVHCQSMKLLNLGSALFNAGYRASISHASPVSIKTDAPHHVVWDIVRAHAILNKVVMPTDEQSVAYKILTATSTTQISFEHNKLANSPSRKVKLIRFQENPTKNWGPMARAGKKRKADHTISNGNGKCNSGIKQVEETVEV